MPEGKRLLIDLREAAEMLDVDYETARLYVQNGYLRAVRLPSLEVPKGAPAVSRRKIQIKVSDVEKFIEKNSFGGVK